MFGLGKKKEPVDVRAMLADAMRDFGGEELSRRAVHFFDNREEYETWSEHSTGEPLWVSDGYDPAQAEIAADILRELLITDNRGVIIDWAEGAEGILNDIDGLFERAGKPKISKERRDALISLCASIKRGGAMAKVMDQMDNEAAARGFVVHWWNTEGDAHLPLLLTPDAKKRWRDVSFGKNFPVLK
jgi:hypothetical protein